jgi:predicted metal-dependent enzyme (double-stranded beta helix superfamily)
MLSVDDLIGDLQACLHEMSPVVAVRDVLARVCARPDELAEALPPNRSEIEVLYGAPDLTVLKVVWGPGMAFQPHNHLMWAAIGIYTGGEDNTFYRRTDQGLAESGGRELRPGDVCLLGDDTIHAVVNPTSQHAGAIHVYGGDLIGTPRSEWTPVTFEESPYDVTAMHAAFAAANSQV